MAPVVLNVCRPVEGSELGGLPARLALGGLHGKQRVTACPQRWSDGRTQGKKNTRGGNKHSRGLPKNTEP